MEVGTYCENDLKVDDELILSHWRVKKEIPVFNVGDTYFISKHQPSIDPDIYRIEDKETNLWLTKKFTTDGPEGQYDTSIAVTEELLDQPSADGRPVAAGIIYPSMKPANKD